MNTSRRKTPVTRFRLNAKISAIASASPDPLVRAIFQFLKEFECSEVIGSRYDWKYLPDHAFAVIYNKPGMSVRMLNRAVLSHFIRVIEAFQSVSLWRSRDLVSSCVASLNEEHLISAATLARSLIELAVTYGEAAGVLRGAFKVVPWSAIGDAPIATVIVSNENGKDVTLEMFIERLMAGTRLNERLVETPNMRQRNILTIIQKLDKTPSGEYEYQLMPHYEFLCEIAHPNTIGFQRYLSSVNTLDNRWETRLMEEKSFSERSVHISFECLWALAFGVRSMDTAWGVFNELKQNVVKNIGRALPH